jgi:hypothetical protein
VTQKELIIVEMKDGTVCRMVGKALNLFLSHDRVTKFKRANGWAVVGVDPLRNKNNASHSAGVERRLAV